MYPPTNQNDPYAAIRNLGFTYRTGRTYAGGGENPQDIPIADAWDFSDDVRSNNLWEAVQAAGLASKYSQPYDAGNGRVGITLQQPGAHKYDTMEAIYEQGADGKWTLVNDPMQAKSRQSSSWVQNRDVVRDDLEKAASFVAAAGAMYGGASMLAGAGGAGGAAAGTTAGATAGAAGAAAAGTGTTLGLTSAQWAAVQAAAVNGAMTSAASNAIQQLRANGWDLDEVDGKVVVKNAASGAVVGGLMQYAGMAMSGAGDAAASVGTEELSGMDLAADAAPGTGNNVYTAGQALAKMGPAVGATTSGAGATSSIAEAVKTGVKSMDFSDWLGLGSVAAGLLNKPETPDTSGMNAAAADSAKLARDSFDWFKAEYEKTAPDRAAATARDAKIGDAQLAAMEFATQEAKDASARNKTVFQPLEDKMVADAKAYDTPERRAAAVAETTAGVESAFGRAQQGHQRALLRMSATPNTTANAALTQDAALAKAKAIAGETGATTRNIEQQGYARMADAVALGKGVIGNQATQQSIATNAGNAGVSAGAGQVAAANSGLPAMQAGTSAALQGLQTAGSLYGQAAQIGNQTRGQDLNFLSNAFNAYMTKSDKNVKKNTGHVTDGTKELAEINATPVEQGWRYAPEKGGPPDDGPRTGPMAQMVRKTMGEAAAPGGHVIDMRVMGGKMMASIQALSRQVDGVERRLARMTAKAA